MAVDLAAEEAVLVGRREPYARVTVVWSRSPVSARAGDAALVTSDGRLRGWVGGSCAEPIVVAQALDALSDGAPRLVHLAPPGELPPEREGLVVAPVTCASEGSLEVFVDPRLPAPHLVAVGRSPLVEALATMAGAVGFDVTVYEREDGDLDLAKAGAGPDSFVVVATMGRYDEDAVEAALATGARYVALVASGRRAETVLAGVAEEDRTRVHAPAGLDLGDLPHVEIAVAILAQIVAEKAARAPVMAAPRAEPDTAVDPVCGMTVEIASAADRFEHDGVTYWFCASGCRRRFERDPAAFVS
ncbi:MAG TPA: XdhC family protein [Acidimicrobiales bacterium]|nr:XdhC family protein [Acidimicrobiales bacterium]